MLLHTYNTMPDMVHTFNIGVKSYFAKFHKKNSSELYI